LPDKNQSKQEKVRRESLGGACDLRSQKAPNRNRRISQQGEKLLQAVPNMERCELVSKVSCVTPYDEGKEGPLVVVYDFGVKTNIVRSLLKRGFRVRVLPYNFPHEDALRMKPAAVCLSNGPGDPSVVSGSTEQIQGLVGRLPILAICMGHQLLARAMGCSTYKLKVGHHGVNHPVVDHSTGRILITSQNHGFAVKAEDLVAQGMTISHQSLNDGCVEGFESKALRALSVQFHPEARPGPSDADYLFDKFLRGYLA
jgi:carbamoyl-phosphate synthase small subunit